MMVTVAGSRRAGRAIDLSAHDLDPDVVVQAIRNDSSGGTPIAIDCPSPGALHREVPFVKPGMALNRRAGLAAAARTLGNAAPQDNEIATLEAKITELTASSTVTETARRRLADLEAKRERLRERVARLQGRVRALRDAGLDTEEAESTLTEAAKTLAEIETDHTAAQQSLAEARENERTARDVRERRLRLEDRLGNLRRAARRHLATEIREEVEAAVADAPGDGMLLEEAGAATVALGVVRVASVQAPIVLVDPPFAGVGAASAWLDAPVLEI